MNKSLANEGLIELVETLTSLSSLLIERFLGKRMMNPPAPALLVASRNLSIVKSSNLLRAKDFVRNQNKLNIYSNQEVLINCENQ